MVRGMRQNWGKKRLVLSGANWAEWCIIESLNKVRQRTKWLKEIASCVPLGALNGLQK